MQIGKNSVIGYKVRTKKNQQNGQNMPVISHSKNQNRPDTISFGKFPNPFKKPVNDYWTAKIESVANIKAFRERLLYGVAAFFTQPFLEWTDKKTDKETKKRSVPRIIGKVVAGTSVGVATRWTADKAANYLSRNNIINTAPKSLSYILSVAATLITVVTIDAPASKFIMNNVMKLFNSDKTSKAEVKKP